METLPISFLADFVWGAATSAYQVEGAWNEEGKGESIWDRFCRLPGKISGGATGDVACDHYHRYLEDVGLMRRLGLKAYRFSISWPRVLPQGRGRLNPAGLAFYDQLIDALLAAGIQPFVTLYHWDLPQALQELGGWPERSVGGHFADYAELMVKHFGDRVRQWATLNEPQVVAFDGYRQGTHAPGIADPRLALQVAHNLLVAHGRAVQAMRAAAPVQVSLVVNLWPLYPASDRPEDVAVAELGWQMGSAWFVSAVLGGAYPPLAWQALGENEPHILGGDWALITQPLDALGINFYSRSVVRAGGGWNEPVAGAEYTDMAWEIHPPALRYLLGRLRQDYVNLPPVYIMENGAAFADTVSADGRVHDPRRIDYLRQHLQQARLAISDGVDLRGYFVWSLLDNFEWSHGYTKRFGLIYVDFATQKRVVKDSAEWYGEVIARNEVF